MKNKKLAGQAVTVATSAASGFMKAGPYGAISAMVITTGSMIYGSVTTKRSAKKSRQRSEKEASEQAASARAKLEFDIRFQKQEAEETLKLNQSQLKIDTENDQSAELQALKTVLQKTQQYLINDSKTYIEYLLDQQAIQNRAAWHELRAHQLQELEQLNESHFSEQTSFIKLIQNLVIHYLELDPSELNIIKPSLDPLDTTYLQTLKKQSLTLENEIETLKITQSGELARIEYLLETILHPIEERIYHVRMHTDNSEKVKPGDGKTEWPNKITAVGGDWGSRIIGEEEHPRAVIINPATFKSTPEVIKVEILKSAWNRHSVSEDQLSGRNIQVPIKPRDIDTSRVTELETQKNQKIEAFNGKLSQLENQLNTVKTEISNLELNIKENIRFEREQQFKEKDDRDLSQIIQFSQKILASYFKTLSNTDTLSQSVQILFLECAKGILDIHHKPESRELLYQNLTYAFQLIQENHLDGELDYFEEDQKSVLQKLLESHHAIENEYLRNCLDSNDFEIAEQIMVIEQKLETTLQALDQTYQERSESIATHYQEQHEKRLSEIEQNRQDSNLELAQNQISQLELIQQIQDRRYEEIENAYQTVRTRDDFSVQVGLALSHGGRSFDLSGSFQAGNSRFSMPCNAISVPIYQYECQPLGDTHQINIRSQCAELSLRQSVDLDLEFIMQSQNELDIPRFLYQVDLLFLDEPLAELFFAGFITPTSGYQGTLLFSNYPDNFSHVFESFCDVHQDNRPNLSESLRQVAHAQPSEPECSMESNTYRWDQKTLIGMGRGFVSLGQGIKQLGLYCAEKVSIIPSGKTAEYTKIISDETRQYANSEVGQSWAGWSGEMLGLAATGFLPGGSGLVGRRLLFSGAVTGAISGGLQATEDSRLSSRARNAGEGLFFGCVGAYGAQKLGQVVKYGIYEVQIRNGLRNFEKNVDISHTFSKTYSKKNGHVVKTGHMPDLPRNRRLLLETSQKENFIYKDQWGKEIFAKMHSDGTESWARIRNGKIESGGINKEPKYLKSNGVLKYEYQNNQNIKP